ncbi:TetR family transcriptional regulator [Vandammella animalimorsus]|uniref:TetR family transcriptional regulator n=1 Tax=Vandammella animalimorsus TaxID=2029117 RepID=A0A2A2T4F4_9BURK|nr:TetR/AcrR family transcriptional regulator [Vandammella animalimorsus]PAT31923.1 TetR family transcriptional regulator [Vandammella animalimorsus]PAX16432.1 TetR family transcriptional regulator [Vandammella animalimorsus]PAX18847.1 TetR family transcriptional regulator [Vandammella animalimorsus]
MQDSTKKILRRGRPPSYDREAALQAIAGVFLQHGYHGTSLDDIASATGMQRPSLFGAFGHKPAMYLLALDWYVQKMLFMTEQALHHPQPLNTCLQGLLQRVIDTYHSGTAPGCLLLCTAPAVAAHMPEVAALLASTLQNMQRQFHDRLLQAQTEREFTSDNIEATAWLLVALVQSCATQARIGQTRAALMDSSHAALTQLLSSGLDGAPGREKRRRQD